ncbi:MAG: TIGR02117 family protein [Gammaproteobacteria bacterium]|nr:TIGR02117 family protein [Gammaproteobacteria bacterium]
MRPLFLIFIILLPCAACSVTTDRPSPSPEAEPSKYVYVIDYGLHSGIIIKKSDVPYTLLPEKDDFPKARYLEFGWGDKVFYQAKKPTLALALQALLTPSLSVLHVHGIPSPPQQYYRSSEIATLRLSQAQFDSLVRYIDDSFERDQHGKSAFIGDGLYTDSRFYLAKGKYHAFNTCNTWTAEAIRSTRVPISPKPTNTSPDVMLIK